MVPENLRVSVLHSRYLIIFLSPYQSLGKNTDSQYFIGAWLNLSTTILAHHGFGIITLRLSVSKSTVI